MLEIVVGFVFGCLVTVLYELATRDTCKHAYKLELTTNWCWDEARTKIDHKIKHYQCFKCLKVKNVRIG